jgi:hypothetical protein
MGRRRGSRGAQATLIGSPASPLVAMHVACGWCEEALCSGSLTAKRKFIGDFSSTSTGATVRRAFVNMRAGRNGVTPAGSRSSKGPVRRKLDNE